MQRYRLIGTKIEISVSVEFCEMAWNIGVGIGLTRVPPPPQQFWEKEILISDCNVVGKCDTTPPPPLL
jgi:hypothetical protein